MDYFQVKRKTAQLKRLIGSTVMKTVHKAKTIAHEVSRHREDGLEVVDEMCVTGEQYIKLKASNSHKGPYEFDCLQHVQVRCFHYTVELKNSLALQELEDYIGHLPMLEWK